MFYADTKPETLHNALSVTTDGYSRCMSTDGQHVLMTHTFASVQQEALYMKSYVRFILAGYIICHKALLCNTQNFCTVNGDI